MKNEKAGLWFNLLRKVSIAFVGVTASLNAAQITWDAPQDIPQNNTYADHFQTMGVFRYAYNCNGTNSVFVTPSLTFVPALTAATFSDANVTITAGGTDGAIVETTTTPPFGNFDAALKGLFGTARQRYNATKGAAYYEVTLRKLIAGHQYQIQAWVNDSRATSPLGRTSIVKDMEGGTQSAEIKHNTNTGSALGGVGQHITGYFVASDTNQVFRFVGEVPGANSTVHCAFISAFQVREMTPMYWTTDAGNWNTMGINWDPAADADTIWTAAIGAVADAYFTNNATATITANVWARDVNVISNTTIKLGTAGTMKLTVMRNMMVDAARLLTVGSGTYDQKTVIVVSNAVAGAGSVDVKNGSRIMLGKGAVGSIKATLNGNGGDFFGAIQSANYANAEWSGEITMTSTARVGAGNNSLLEISGKITGSTLTIRAADATALPVGIVRLSNPNNTYAGDTSIFSPLQLGCDNAIPIASKWLFVTGAKNPSVDLNGFNQEVQSFSGTLAGSNITNSNVAASVLIVSNTVDQTATLLKLAGNLSVIKRGPAKLTFGATNTYSGTTTIEAGTNALSAAGEIASTSKLILAGGTFDVSAKTGYLFAKPLQVTTNSSIVGTLTMGATTDLAFDGANAPLAGGVITMAGQTLKLTTTTTLAKGVDYPLVSGYTNNVPMLDTTGLSIPEGATASLLLAGDVLKLSIVAATQETDVTVTTLPTGTVTYGTNITVTASVEPSVPDGGTVNLYAAEDLNTVIASWIVSGSQAVFTFVKPAAGTYSYVAKYMGGGIYSNSQSEASSVVTIQPKTITISGVDADKLFDGTANVTPRYSTAGVLPGEPNPVSCVASYADANIGSSKTVTLTWYMPNTDYALSDNPATVLGTIYESAVWTGGGVNNFWQTQENWTNNLVPNSSAVAALFNTDATVSLSTDVNIKKLLFNGNVTLNGPGAFIFPQQNTVTGEVSVAVNKTATFNALIAVALAGVPKKGLGTMILMGNHGFDGKLDVREGVAEINKTTEGALTARDYTVAENATLRFVCAAIVSTGTQLTGPKAVTGDGIFEVVSGFLRIQSSTAIVSMSMGSKGQIIVRDGAFLNNNQPANDRFVNNKAILNVQGTGLFGLNNDMIKVGSLHGDGQVKAEYLSHSLTITGDSDGAFSGTLTQKDAGNKLTLVKSGLGTQILSGTNSYTGPTTINGGCLTLTGGTNRLSVNTPVTVTNAVLNLGLTQQTFNTNPVFRAESKLAVDVSKTDIGRLTLTNSVDVSGWNFKINNPSDYPKGKRYAVISTGTDKVITGTPTLVDTPSGFIIYNRDNAIYVDFPAMVIFFR